MKALARRRFFAAFLGLAVAALGPLRPGQAAAEPPRRIVSTSPSITETLFALGLGDRVVGVSRYCRYPPAVLALPKVGTFLKPDVESIARLTPDLVLIHASADGLEGRLAAVHLRAISVERGAGLAGVFTSISAIGDAAGVPERARALVAEIQAVLGQMRAAAKTAKHPKVLLIVGRRPGTLTDIVAVGRNSYLGELLEVAGGSNVLDDPGLPEYPRISLETVIRLRPDLIIDTGDMGDTPQERERNGRANEALWRRNALVTAMGIKRIHAATTDALVVPGPRVTEAATWLRSLVQKGRVP